MEKYAVINQEGLVINVAIWDGITEWPINYEVIKLPTDSRVGNGYIYDPTLDEFVSPVVEP